MFVCKYVCTVAYNVLMLCVLFLAYIISILAPFMYIFIVNILVSATIAR